MRIIRHALHILSLVFAAQLGPTAQACDFIAAYTPVRQSIEITLSRDGSPSKIQYLTISPTDGSDDLSSQVKFANPPSREMTVAADANGIIRARLKPGYYSVSIEQFENVSVIARILVQGDGKVSRLTLEVPPPQPVGEELVTGSFDVRIADPTGAVIPGASAVVLQDGRRILTTSTDAEGRLSFPLEKGKYLLVVKASGFITANVPLLIGDTRTADVLIKMQVDGCPVWARIYKLEFLN